MKSIVNVRTVLPAFKKATFWGFGDKNDANASGWAWTSLLHEVCPIMRQHFMKNRAGEWTDFGLGKGADDDFFGRYGFLNGVQDGKPRMTWATFTTVDPVLVINGDRPIHPPIDPVFIHLPMGWVKHAIFAAEAGIVRITCESIPTPVQTGRDNIPFMVQGLIGHDLDGAKFEVILDGSGGYRYLPLSKHSD